MNTHRCLKIAERINAPLLRELGQGIEAQRMLTEPLYARDVLLVCDALPGTDLASLAQRFRVAATEQPELGSPNPLHAGGDSTIPGAGSGPGFRIGSRIGSRISSRVSTGAGAPGHGTASSLDPQADATAPPPPRRWFSPARWLAGK